MFRSFEGKNVPLVSVSRVTGTVKVYDPAMCCSTGVCGPEVDTALVQFAGELRRVEAQGMKVERFNLSQQPLAFVENQRVSGLLQAFGEDALPVILVNDIILVYGRYPSKEEMTRALETNGEQAASKNEAGNCCDPNSGCC